MNAPVYSEVFAQLATRQSNSIPDFGIVHHMPTVGNPVYIKQMHLAAGHVVETHQHEYTHYGLLGEGAAHVEVDGKATEHTGPCVITIEAGKRHKITAMTNITWFCIHATDEIDVAAIDNVLIKKSPAPHGEEWTGEK
jgi:quercetin dioxygenase-like cupin family protein